MADTLDGEGTVDETGASGTIKLMLKLQKNGERRAKCKSGKRAWDARVVSEEKWLDAGEKPFK